MGTAWAELVSERQRAGKASLWAQRPGVGSGNLAWLGGGGGGFLHPLLTAKISEAIYTSLW